MAAQLDPADLPLIAKAAGKSGKPLPPWAKGNPELEAAHREGAGIHEEPATDEPDEATATSSDDPPGGSPSSGPDQPPTRPSAKRGGAGGRRSPQPKRGGASKPKKVTAAVGGAAVDLAAHPATLGSDGGGLMLAVFAYPIVLAMLQHGPGGLVLWLKAKFLNKTTAPVAAAGAGGATVVPA